MLWKYKKHINNDIQLSIGDYDNYKPFYWMKDKIIMGKRSSLKKHNSAQKIFIKIKNNNTNEENKPVDQLVERSGVDFQCQYGGSLPIL